MAESAGRLIARILAGAWRPKRDAVDIELEELAQVATLLHQTGAGALVWWTLRHSPMGDAETVQGFHDAYRIHTMEAEAHALRAADVLGRLAAAGVTPLLVKGWAVARLYPEVGLRPYTDLDLIVRPSEMATARAILREPPAIGVAVDLHEGPDRLDRLDFHDLVARAEVAMLGDQPVRIPGAEDHLRFMALHALRHGVFRPIWLVDLAVALEARTSGFDWMRCLGADPRRADWVASALALAARLLGARVEGTPAAGRLATLPAWLIRAVLRNWSHGTGRSHLAPVFGALVANLGHPASAWAEARRRWDRPIEATLEVGGPFNRLPRWPYQVAAVVRRSPELLRALRRRAALQR